MKIIKKVSCGLIIVLVLAVLILGTACTGSRGEQGERGEPGLAGVGIESIVDNGDGTFTLRLSDGSSFTTSNLTGPAMPVIQSLTVSGLPAKPGATVTASVVAQSATGLTLTYSWTVSTGWTIVSGADSDTVTITAPSSYSTGGTATVNVTDSKGRTATGVMALCTERNHGPIIHSLGTSGNPVRPGGIIEIFASAADPDGDALTYQWSVPSGWVIQSGQGTVRIRVVAPNKLLAGGYATLSVSDGNGASAAGSLYIGTVDGVWGTAVLIETGSGGALYPQVAVDPNGNAVAVWYQHDGTRNNIWANRFAVGTGWGTAVLIETDNSGDAYYPQVAVDPSGNAVAVWYQYDGIRYNIWANRFAVGTGWGMAVMIETDNSGNADSPQVAVDPSGNAVAVWQQWDGTRYNIWANRFQ